MTRRTRAHRPGPIPTPRPPLPDADSAGDKAAAGWPARARRVRPPGSFKDWTEARAAGVDLARWWRALLAGDPRPPLVSWDELARWRRGPAETEPASGIENPGRPFNPEWFARSLTPDTDPYTAAEREAMRGDS
jgi:hypothetical protein